MSVGDFLGFVSGGSAVGDFAGLVTLGSFTGGSVSGYDSVALTQGNLNGSVSASHDAAAFAIGNISGNISAGNDATLAAFGSIANTVTVSAGRDIADIWSASSIDGTFNAGRNIGGMTSGGIPTMGGIFSYGSISGTFTAGNDIAPASAVGSIGGSFSGLNVGDLTAGGANTATTPGNTGLAGMTAPSIPSDVLFALGTAQGMMNQSVIDYFTATSQAQTDLAGIPQARRPGPSARRALPARHVCDPVEQRGRPAPNRSSGDAS